MSTTRVTVIRWAARGLGIGVALFLGVFALDAFGPDRPVGRALLDLGIHLAPTALLLLTIALAWRREWIGGLAFLAIAVAYALTPPQRPDWILAISGPLGAVGLLFLWSWRERMAQRQAD